MNQELKKAIDVVFEAYKRQYQADGRTELLDFLSYLSASDGKITTVESEFLKTHLDVCLSPEELRVYIEKNHTYTVEFEQRVPELLKECVEADREALRAREKEKMDDYPSDALTYCDLFECAAKEFIACDGEVCDQEIADMTTYLTLLNQYRKKELPCVLTARSKLDTKKILAGGNSEPKQETVEPKKLRPGEEESSRGEAGAQTQNQTGSQELNALIEELNDLIGLDTVKKDVTSHIHLQEIMRMRRERGLKEIPISNHLVFYGNPGTGKTTVARLLAKIYHAMGILSKGQFVETDRSGLVGGYVGQTALKVQEVIQSALGGVLFIDEAYALTMSESLNDYGREAVETLLKAMEDHRDDIIVIVAGYPAPMRKFIHSNPGLRSRFNKYINFEDYNPEQLLSIFEFLCKTNGYTASQEAIAYTADFFRRRYENRGDNFANGREVRNFFETGVLRQADRLFSMTNPSNEELCELVLEDVGG